MDKMSDLLINLAGWSGAALLLLAYLLVSNRKLAGDSLAYQLLNLIGSFCLLLNAHHFGAWPSVGVNAVWIAIALLTVAKSRPDNKKEE
jgi:hypothetical protein